MLRDQWQPTLKGAPDEDHGIVHLDDVGVLGFEGPDVLTFMQGYLTADTELLTGDAQFTALCNIKGRTVCTGYVWRTDRGLVLVLHRTLCRPLLEFLKPYLAFSRTEARDLTGETLVFGALDVELQMPRTVVDEHRQLRLVTGSDEANALWAQHHALDPDRWLGYAIDRQEVWLEQTTSGEFLPQMIGLDRIGAVSFDKGCYLGQEVVARAQHRGKVKRELRSFIWSGKTPAPGVNLTDASGKGAGSVVATTRSGNTGRALAVVQRDTAAPLYAGDTEFAEAG